MEKKTYKNNREATQACYAEYDTGFFLLVSCFFPILLIQITKSNRDIAC